MANHTAETEQLEAMGALFDRIRSEASKVIVGQDAIIRFLLVCLFVRGHCLLVGVPGLAKTLLVRTLANALNNAGLAHSGDPWALESR